MRRSPFALLLALVFALVLPAVAQADVNLALRAWGGEASASSVHSSGAYPASAVNDNTRQARNGYWNDNTHGQYPDWVQVAWETPRTINKLVVRIPLAESHHSMDVRTLRNARLQIWRAGGSAWEDAGSSITNWSLPLAYDGSEIRSVDLPSPTAVEKVRFLVDEGTGEGWSWLEELEAWGPADRPNQALAAMGGRATASSTYPGFPVHALNDGRRQDRALYWNDFNKGVWPDWAQIDWDRPRTIDTIVVRVPLTDPALPEGADTLKHVRIQAWDEGGQEWTDVDAPVTDWVLPVTRDGSEKKTFTFPEVQTDKVRVLVEQGNSEGWSLLEEIEAYGPWPNPNLALPGWGARVFANSQYPEYPMGAVQNGHRERRIGYWNDNTVWQWPDFVGVEWDAPQTIQEVILRLPVSFPEFTLAQRTIKRSRVQIMRPGSTAWEDVGDPILDWTMPLVADGSEVMRVPLPAPTQVVKVRYLVDEGNAQGWSMLDELEVYRTSPPALPLNVSPPSVAGAAGIGASLTCDPGAWTGATDLRYRWERDGQLISRNQTYTLTQADGDGAIRCVVTGMNEAGMTSRATPATVFLPRPPAPTTLDLASGQTSPDADGDFTLTWTAVSGASRYIVERAPAGSSTFTEVGQSTTTSLTLTDQGEGQWVYRVRSVVAGVESRPSSPSPTIVVDLTPPDLSLICPSEVLSVGQTASASINAIDAQSGLASTPPTGLALDTLTAGDRTATYTVSDNAGHSTTATCTYQVRPAAPSAPVLAAGDSSPDDDGLFGLTWGTAAGASQYILQRAPATAGIPVWTEIARTSGASITFTSPEPEGAWQYRVIAVADGLQSLPSTASSDVVVDRTPPALTLECPTGVVAIGSTAGATITASDAGSGLTAIPPPSIALDTNTSGPGTATYTVTDRAGHSTTRTCSYDVGLPAPSAPVLQAPDVSPDADGRYSLSWDAVPAAAGYVLERLAAGGSTWTEVARPTTNTMTFSTTPEPEGRWFYRVRAVNGSIESVPSPISSEVMVDTTAPSLTLTCPTLVGVGDAASASVAAGDALSGFADVVPAAIPVATSSPGTQSVSYTVTDRAGHSTTRTCSYDVRPPAPTRPVLDAPHVSPDGDGLFGISWGAVAGATRYIVERTSNGGATWTEIAQPTTTTLTFSTTAQPEGVLHYRVRAVAGTVEGLTSPPSADILVDLTAPTLTLTCPANPVGVGELAGAAVSANDNLAGFADPIPGAIALDTSSPGVRTASYTVTDRAGHSTTRSCSYEVRPPAPTAPVLASPHTSPDADGRYTITWSTISGATRYVVERAPAGSSTWSEIGQPTTNSLTFSTTPQAEGTWNYRVRAVAGTVDGLTSPPSADVIVDVTPPTLTLTCPTGVIAVGDTVAATIAANDNLSGFVAGSVPASIVVTTATPGPKTATYTVTDRAGHSTTATCSYDVRPPAPTAPVVDAPDTYFDGDGRFTLSWSTVSGATRYIVERAPNGGSTWTEIAQPTTNSLTFSTTPQAEGAWNYRVRAVAGGVEGATSPRSGNVIVDQTPPTLSLTCPTGVIGVGDTVSATITASDALAGIADAIPPSIVVTTTSPGPKTATYTVTDRAGNSTTRTCSYDVRPAAPTAPVVDAPDTYFDGDGRYTISWSSISGATRYIVERAPNGGSTWTEIGQPTTNSLTFSTTPQAEGAWNYRVRAVAGGVEGATSPRSANVIVDLTAPSLALTCPTGVIGVGDTVSATIAASDSGSGLAGTVPGSFVVTTSSPGPKIATYTVSDRAGNSTTANCTYDVRPAAPTAPVVDAPDTYFDGDGRFTLSWSAISGATRYIVERAPNGGSTWTEIAQPTTNSLTFSTTPQAEGAWNYRVRAVAGGVEGATSPRSGNVIVDQTAPNLTLTCPTGVIGVGDTVSATIAASDALAGIADAIPASMVVPTTSPGPKTATYTVTDRAGNSTTRTCSYDVRPAAPTRPVVAAPDTNYDPDGRFTLTWGTVSGATRYIVERAPASGSTWTEIGQPTTNSLVFNTTPEAEGTWRYRVRAVAGGVEGATSANSDDVVVDLTDPSLTLTCPTGLLPHNSPANASVTASDSGSGLASTPVGALPLDTSVPGDRTATYTVTDRAGRSTTRTCTYTVRPPAPGAPQVAAPDTYFDRDGRFTLTWTAASGASAYIVERSPASGSTWTELGRPTTNSITFNTPAQAEGTWIYRVTSIAGSAQSAPSPNSAVVTVDMTAPTVSLTCPTGTIYVGDTASATLTASDSLSGLTTAPPAGVALVTSSAGDRTATYTATDRAGNTTTQTCAYSVRYRGPNAPVVTAGANPGTGAITLGWTHPSGTPATTAYVLEARDANDTGWTQIATPTTNSWTVPAGSPLAQGTWTFRVRANHASYEPAWSPSSANVVVDRTSPNAPSLTADRAPDLDNTGTADDWYRGTVTLSFAGNGDPVLADGSPGSGVDPASVPANRTFNTTGTHTATGTVRDRAGNTTASVSQTVRVDADIPTTTLTCPTGDILQDSTASASWTAADVGSGLVGAASGTITIDTSTVGTRTATVPVTRDRAGNTAATRTCTYRVIYNWTGFLDPIDNGGVYNDVIAGDRVPIPFQLNGNRGLSVLAGPPTFTPVSCGVAGSSRDDLEFTAPSWVPAGLSYQATYNAYVWVWETNNTHRNNCYDIAFTLNDGTAAHVARYRVK